MFETGLRGQSHQVPQSNRKRCKIVVEFDEFKRNLEELNVFELEKAPIASTSSSASELGSQCNHIKMTYFDDDDPDKPDAFNVTKCYIFLLYLRRRRVLFG